MLVDCWCMVVGLSVCLLLVACCCVDMWLFGVVMVFLRSCHGVVVVFISGLLSTGGSH